MHLKSSKGSPVRLPHSEKSRAVIVGTSFYGPDSGFEPLPAVTKNLDDLSVFLRERTGLKHVTVVNDPSNNRAIMDAIVPAARDAQDLLLFYYAGHGVSVSAGNDVGLTTLESSSDAADWSTLQYAVIRDQLHRASAAIKIVILDCCHSGSAFGSGTMANADNDENLKDLAVIDGAYVLTAANKRDKFAMAAGVHGRTAFTGALLEVLRAGIDSDDEYLTMAAVFPLVADRLRAANKPAPRSSGFNTAASIALARNAQRTLGSLSQHCNNIFDTTSPFSRHVVVGAAGTGKSALMQRLVQRCHDDNLLALKIVTPHYDIVKKPGLADIDVCAKLLSDLITSIKAFEEQRHRWTPATTAAKDTLGATRNPNMWFHLIVESTADITLAQAANSTSIGGEIIPNGERIDPSTMLEIIGQKTLDAVRGLAAEHKLVILVDDIDRLDNTSMQDWLRELLNQLPAYRTVTFRHPGNNAWRQDHDDATDIITLNNMSADEVREYLNEQGLDVTEEDARRLFKVTRGRPFAVTAWCDLALNSNATQFTDLDNVFRSAVYDKDFTRLTERARLTIDQIAADVLGYQAPLFDLLTIAEQVTPALISMLEGDDGRTPKAREAARIYQLLAQRTRLLSPFDPRVEEGVSLPQVIRDVAWPRLQRDRARFWSLQSSAEQYERGKVDINLELNAREKKTEPFAAWKRFEQATWIDSLENWINHIGWLRPDDFQAMKPALVKLYLDAFWWWDDYLRSKATSDIGTLLKKVGDRQQPESWINLLQKLSDNWVSSWSEAVLCAHPEKWESVQEAITGLRSTFGFEYDQVPPEMPRRRIYILLCIFYAKALWYAGSGTPKDADEADDWLAAAYRACQKQPGDEAQAENPNGWIGSWARLRQAEIWAALDPERAIGCVDGLDQAAMDDDDDDVRIGAAMLSGDLWWRRGDYARALDVYSRAAQLSYSYNGNQEKERKAPNLYTKLLYASTIRHVQEKISQAEQSGDPAVLAEIDTGLAAARDRFQQYWRRVNRRSDRPVEPARFQFPVPPPWPGDVLELDSRYMEDLEYVVGRWATVIKEPIEPPPANSPSGRKSH
jgi:GTPase SAR1 family protein